MINPNVYIRSTSLVSNDGPEPRLEGLRAGQSQTDGKRTFAPVGWYRYGTRTHYGGSGYGIRAPMRDETPLSDAEVNVFIRMKMGGEI